MKLSRMKCLVVVTLGLVLLIVVNSDAQAGASLQEDPAETLFDQAMVEFGAGAYGDAILLFQQLLDRYPNSEWADEAQLGLGASYFQQDNFEQAIAELSKVPTEYPKSEYADGAQFTIGMIYEYIEAYIYAVEAYQSVLDHYPDSHWRDDAHFGIGICHYLMGDFEQAKTILQTFIGNYPDSEYTSEAQKIIQDIECREMLVSLECVSLKRKGETLHYQAKYSQAQQKFQDALTCYREAGDRAGEGVSLNNIGLTYRHLGQYEEALVHYEQALSISREIGDHAEELINLKNIGAVYINLEHYQEALIYYQQALSISQEINDRTNESVILSNIGCTHTGLGQHEDALDYSLQALTIQQEIGDRAKESITLSNIGSIYYSLGQYKEALDYSQQALTILQEIGDRAGESTTLNNIGNIYSNLEQHEKALEYHQQALAILQEIDAQEYRQQALAIWQDIDAQAAIGRTLNRIGLTYYHLKRYSEALDYSQRALSIFQKIGDRVGEGGALHQIGGIYGSLEQFREALNYSQKALTILQEVGDRAREGATLTNIGASYGGLGRNLEALNYFQQALAILQEVGDRAGEGTALSSIGESYNNLGLYEEALNYSQQALTISREIGDRAVESAALMTMGVAYTRLGQHLEALDYNQQALSIQREIGERAAESATLNNIGIIYALMGQFSEAEDYHQMGLSIAREIGNLAAEEQSIMNIGSIHFDLGRYEEALNHYQQALEIAQDRGDRVGEGLALMGIGVIYAKLEQYQWALDYHQQALTIQLETGDQARKMSNHNNIGIIYERLGDYQKALDHYQQAVAVVETMRGEMTVEEFKSGLTADRMHMYYSVISLLVRIERPDEVFGYVQRAKARTFLDQLGNVRVNARTTDNPILIDEEETLRVEVQSLDRQLREEWAKPSEQRSDDVIRSLEAQLAQKREAYAKLLTRLKLENSEYASLVSVSTLTLTQTQGLLTDTTLVEYYIVSDTLTLAFVVTPNEFYLEQITVALTVPHQSLWDFYGLASLSAEEAPESLQSLYDVLIRPIEVQLDTHSLIIAPHSILHYVPFAALYDGEQYLVERHAITQLPSASVLPFILEKRKGVVGTPLVLGDPDGSLQFSRQEAQAVAELYGITAYVGEEALEQLVWEQGAEAGILHLSTHGVYNERAPLFSKVLLASDEEGQYDGVLEVHEVYNLDLGQADLVVLSACQSNLGERSAGDEIVGLNRALIYAGTPSVLASLWNVEDEATRDLMVGFYGYLKRGYAKDEALRQAQKDVMQNPRTAHPYYWAGFVLTGDGSSLRIHVPFRMPLWMTVLAFTGLLVCWVVCVYVNKKQVPTDRIMGYMRNRPRYIMAHKYPATTRQLAKGGMIGIPVLIVILVAMGWYFKIW